MAHRPVKFFQVGSFAAGNRLLDAIHCSDHAVGMLLDAIEERGLLDSTVVVVVGDHMMFPGTDEQAALGKDVVASYYGRVFMALRAPRRDLPPRIETFTFTPDLAPTILELLGVPVPQDMDGRTLLEDAA